MNVAADEFFNSLADDSDIIRSGPIIKWHIILRYVNAERGKYFSLFEIHLMGGVT